MSPTFYPTSNVKPSQSVSDDGQIEVQPQDSDIAQNLAQAMAQAQIVDETPA